VAWNPVESYLDSTLLEGRCRDVDLCDNFGICVDDG